MRGGEVWSRRQWMVGCGAALSAAAEACRTVPMAEVPHEAPPPPPRLSLDEYQPRSTLRVSETHVERARFPAIDVHTHISMDGDGGPTVELLAPPAELLAVMDRRNVRAMVHVTGGYGEHLAESVRLLEKAHPGRFYVFTEPMWSRAGEPGYATLQADEIRKAHRAGARGLKVLKTLGLFLREGGGAGPLVRVDDPRFDPMWEACGELGMPVAIHVGDPAAFFLPIDRFNERYEELEHHPDWSFYDRDFPPLRELLAALDRVVARHPRTRFLGMHVGCDAEDLAAVGERLDRLPNFVVEIGARINELGRQPRATRRFFERYQDRVLFGTDAVPSGFETPQQVFGDELYRIYFRFLETEDEYFDYAPAPVPPQGRWRIYGLGLPEPILRKVYYENAERLLGLA
jgi:peptidoglycan/xylan/chitin deacetylase (PgdA/CDA1 family)